MATEELVRKMSEKLDLLSDSVARLIAERDALSLKAQQLQTEVDELECLVDDKFDDKWELSHDLGQAENEIQRLRRSLDDWFHTTGSVDCAACSKLSAALTMYALEFPSSYHPQEYTALESSVKAEMAGLRASLRDRDEERKAWMELAEAMAKTDAADRLDQIQAVHQKLMDLGQMPRVHKDEAIQKIISTTTHTVVAGDTPASIAEKYTGNASRYPELVLANPTKRTTNYIFHLRDANFQEMIAGEVLQLPKHWVRR